ncbi:MAG TPA: phosphoglucosamine mutase [Leptolyngbyaceae cyanobacterium]
MVKTPVRTQLFSGSQLPLGSGDSLSSLKQINLNSANNPLNLPATPLFGTDGIRGRVGDLLNAELALHIGFWAGQVLQSNGNSTGPVIVGQDTRNSSDMLAMALAAGLTSAGLEVWHLGVCPTPCVAYLSSVSQAAGGIMISASHNPPEDNGIKIFGPDGTKLSKELQAEIEAGLRRNHSLSPEASNWGKHFDRQDLVSTYAESLQKPLLPEIDLRGMRIVLDLAWGAAVNLAPQVFASMGAEVISLHDVADGDRINVNCGSTHLEPLKTAVRQYNADLGFAFDGDADRVLAVDAQGRVVDGDYILYFWGKTLSQAQQLPKNMIVATVMANLGFEKAWKNLGGEFLRTAVGDQYVHAEMLRQGAMLGGEQSGHILCRHYGVSGDGLLTSLHLAALVKRMNASLSQLIDSSFQTYPQLLKNVRVEDRERRLNWKNCDRLTSTIAQAEADMADRGRVLVRASGTEPLIRVMVEAVSADLADRWANNLVAAVQQYLVA